MVSEDTTRDEPQSMSTLLEESEGGLSDLEQELELQLAGDSMASIFEESAHNFKEGEVVSGSIVELGDDRLLVDIGYKSEGVVQRGEFSMPDTLSVGDTFDFYIDDPENDQGMPVLSKIKADRIKNWEKVQVIYEDDGVIEGVITRRVKGGLKVDIGIDAFMPASQLTFRPTGDLERYIGQKLELKIIKLTMRRRNVVVSRRKLLEEERAGEKQKLLDKLEPGITLEGEVKNITDFGAFIDVGGIDGLLHVTDMSWGRVKHPSQIVEPGQKLEVKVLSFDPERERISLGLKQLKPNPWIDAVERYSIGSVVRGRVVSMTDYGAFVQFEEGIEGMVHVSEMSWTRRIRHPNEIIELEYELDVMILSVNPESEKIALGVKQTQPNPWQQITERYPIGTVVNGTVRNLTDYGAFIQIEDGIDGLLHVSDLSWTKKVSHPSEILEKEQEIEVKILSVDPEAEKISVGLKQMESDPWLAVIEKYSLGAHIEVEIAKLVSFGAFARLENGVEGLIHVSELSTERVQKPEEILAIGDKVMTKVISVDAAERKIGLSIRDYQRDLDGTLMDEHGTSEGEGGEKKADAVAQEPVPESKFQAGRSLTDVADELRATVNAANASKAETPTTAGEPTLEEPAPEEPTPEEPTQEETAPAEEAAPESGDDADDSQGADVPTETAPDGETTTD